MTPTERELLLRIAKCVPFIDPQWGAVKDLADKVRAEVENRPSGVEECPKCHGTGDIEWVTKPDEDGSSESGVDACPTCDGRGVVDRPAPPIDKTCDTCLHEDLPPRTGPCKDCPTWPHWQPRAVPPLGVVTNASMRDGQPRAEAQEPEKNQFDLINDAMEAVAERYPHNEVLRVWNKMFGVSEDPLSQKNIDSLLGFFDESLTSAPDPDCPGRTPEDMEALERAWASCWWDAKYPQCTSCYWWQSPGECYALEPCGDEKLPSFKERNSPAPCPKCDGPTDMVGNCIQHDQPCTGRAAEAPITPPNPPHWAEQQRLDAAAREWLTSLLGYRTTDDGRTWAQETRQLIDHLLSKLGEVQ